MGPTVKFSIYRFGWDKVDSKYLLKFNEDPSSSSELQKFEYPKSLIK